ncbi:MAG: hypothetical protein EHM80_04580 [Nitrospiraceae bacterium]|nr:MAG: hypothetical protein EHM80_04580 [Nitrospiraceae bacterium]
MESLIPSKALEYHSGKKESLSMKDIMDSSSKSHRLFKKIVRQGRSERRGESYLVSLVEPLSDARTMLAGFFNSMPISTV